MDRILGYIPSIINNGIYMKKSEAHKIVSVVAKNNKYKYRTGKYWMPTDEVTPAIELQQHPWGNGLYVNVGGYFSKLYYNKPSPPSHQWLVRIRAEHAGHEYREFFLSLATDHDNSINPSDLEAPFEWIFQWCFDTITDTDSLKNMIMDPSTPIGLYSNSWATDWASGQL